MNWKKLSLSLCILLTVAACNLPQEQPIVFERPEVLQFIHPPGTPLPPGVTPAPPERVNLVDELISGISVNNLRSWVDALAAVPSRHVHNPGRHQAAEMIFEGFSSSGGRLNVAYQDFEIEFDGLISQQRNVIARLPGSDPDIGVVLIGAHYDSRLDELTDGSNPAPGANDNASGVAALLEIARLLSDQTPIANIDFVAFGAEEVGALGSEFYLQTVQERGEVVRGVIILDIVGNSAGAVGNGVIRAFSSPPDTSVSRQLARWVSSVALVYTPDLHVQVEPSLDRPGRYSDHVPFSRAGIPAIRLIEAVEVASRQHSPFDLPQYVDVEYLRQAAQLGLASVVNLAFGFELPAPEN
ncbi:MAG: M20/M25/M40 family metallo-hydrolase [Anaerolineae bacterium]|nr:M20/M25/M40 family metallo-hydrolase [Anaerolineae bacterium]